MSDTTNDGTINNRPDIAGDTTAAEASSFPGSERAMAAKQDEPRTSETLDDPDVDADQVQTLPGSGSPDDGGTVEVDPEDLNLPWRE